jgi:hypothetical protein
MASRHHRLRRKPRSRGVFLVTHSTASLAQEVEPRVVAGPIPGHGFDDLGVKPPDPAVDGAAAAVKERGDSNPG